MLWFKKKPDLQRQHADARQPLPPCVLQTREVVIQLVGEWKQVGVDPDGRIEFRCSDLPEQLFVTERKFTESVHPDRLQSMLLDFLEHSRNALIQFAPSAAFEPVDLRKGNGQAEARLVALAPDFQAAFLHRGDANRAFSISLYRYPPLSSRFAEYAGSIFDFVQLSPTP